MLYAKLFLLGVFLLQVSADDIPEDEAFSQNEDSLREIDECIQCDSNFDEEERLDQQCCQSNVTTSTTTTTLKTTTISEYDRTISKFANVFRAAAELGRLGAMPTILLRASLALAPHLVPSFFDCTNDFLRPVVESRDGERNGMTPLMLAAQNGHRNVVKFLIQHCHVDVFSRDQKHGRMAVHFTAMAKAKANEVASLFIDLDGSMLEAKDSENETLLSLAVTYGNLHLVKYLIDDRNVSVDQRAYGEEGRTPLMIAAMYSNLDGLDILKYLVERGAQLDAATFDAGRMAIHFAALQGSVPALSFLLQKMRPAELYSVDNFGNTVLHYAARTDKLEVVKFLVKEKAFKVDYISKNSTSGRTALIMACIGSNISMVKYLVEEVGCDITASDVHYFNGLMYALRFQKEDLVDYFLGLSDNKGVEKMKKQAEAIFGAQGIRIKWPCAVPIAGSTTTNANSG